VRCRSRCSKIFTTLRPTTSSSSSTLVWERNPRVRSTRVCLRTSVYRYNITSIGPWAIRGCVANKYLLFAPNPNNHLCATSSPPDPLVPAAGDHHRARDPAMEAALRRPLSMQEGGETSPSLMLRGLRPAAPSGGGEGREEGRRRPGVVALGFPPSRSHGASRGRRFFS
jgi:hypothetical protein